MNRLKAIIPTLIITIMLIIGVCNAVDAVTPNDITSRASGGSEEDGQIVFNATKAEIFKELHEYSYDNLTAHEVSRWLFKDYGLSMWCIEHHKSTEKHMTATEKHYWAYQKKEEGGATAYNFKNPYYWYRRSAACGMIYNYESKWSAAKSAAEGLYCHEFYYEPYKGDDGTFSTGALGFNHDNLPGVGEPRIESVEWNRTNTFSFTKHPDAAFVLTQQKRYDRVEDMPFEGTGWLTELPYTSLLNQEEINKGYFTLGEKQAALWDTSVSQGDSNDQPDRNLAFMAERYMNFYNTLRNNESKVGADESPFKEVVKPNYVDENGQIQEIDDVHVKQVENKQLKDPISGEMDDCDTYQYENLKIQTYPDLDSPENSSYIIGPFVIDYTVDDEYLDSYDIEGSIYEGESDDTEVEQVKFSAIEKITVYNKNGDNVEDLGGSFKIAYKCKNGAISDEAKVKRIQDEYYYEYADGEEMSAAMSRKPFYIVVYRGEMKVEDFLGFYAKIDFQYLDSCEAEMYEYKGKVIEYWYTETEKDVNFIYTHRGMVEVGHNGCDEDCSEHHHKASSGSDVITAQTYEYELHRAENGEYAQTNLVYGWGNRNYKKYSIIITGRGQMPQPEIEIVKICKDCGEKLYGAKFEAELHITGTDVMYNRKIDKTIYLDRITDRNGKFTITTPDVNDHGVYLPNLSNATLKLHLKEVRAPGGHRMLQEEYDYTIKLERGRITSAPGGTVSSDGLRVKASFEIENEEIKEPKILLEKINKYADTGATIDVKAYFNIQVSYTRDGGELNKYGRLINLGPLVDKKYNVIRGQTKRGQLALTSYDFERLPDGFTLNGYTGELTLKIVEVAAEGGWTVSPKSKVITLVYYKGELLNYSRYTDAEVTAHQVYDNPVAQIYNYVTGKLNAMGESGDYIPDTEVIEQVDRERIETWAREQMAETGKSYKDVLKYLVEYIKKNNTDSNGKFNLPSKLEEWTNSTMTTYANKDGIVRVTIEDTPGEPTYELPDIPYKEEPMLMRFAGTVFLDERVTKDDDKESNGKLDSGELPIKGVEVTLYDAKTGQPAKLVKSENPKEIRTNPTMTDINGRYEFRGVDPMKKYYIGFKYNGMEFETTKEGEEAVYNSPDWAVTSKASTTAEKVSSGGVGRDGYKVVNAENANTPYDYYEIEGIYQEMANLTFKYMIDHNEYPTDKYQLVINAHRNDREADRIELQKKINYMKDMEYESFAGYSPNGSKQETYPHKSLGVTYMTKEASTNAAPTFDGVQEYGDEAVEFASDVVKRIYPGQLQIHCGLVERPSVDLSLVSDIVNTTVSINRYDTTYDYNTQKASYHQYIFKEDYDYSQDTNNFTANEGKGNGVAVYTEDNVHFYITYEITVANQTAIPTKINRIINHYNKNLRFVESGYTTTKGVHIPAIGSYIGDNINLNNYNALGVSVGNAIYGVNTKSDSPNYRSLIVNVPNGWVQRGESNSYKIRLTYELVGTAEDAKQILTDKLKEDQNGNGYARSWVLGNFSEIYEYETQGSYLDSNSIPGSFSIKEYQTASNNFQKAMKKYLSGGGKSAQDEMNMWFARTKEMQQDDTWYEAITLSNNDNVRTLTGNVWEAIDGNVKNSLGLYKNGPLKYNVLSESDKLKLALKDIRVELVELLKGNDTEGSDGANQIVRAVTTTDEKGNYEFKSYIAGDYTVRFVYGGEGTTPYSKVTTNKFEYDETNTIENEKQDADLLPINGQYYQSTKANPISNTTKYWYKVKDYDEKGWTETNVENEDLKTRYSDAYDDAYSRLSQMNSKIKEQYVQNAPPGKVNTPDDTKQTSSDYDYQGVMSVEGVYHNDPIYAYTSTMELEIEYIRPNILGNEGFKNYEYDIGQIDFGVTPRARNDVGIETYISNVKFYNSDSRIQVDANYNREGDRIDASGNLIDLKGMSNIEEIIGNTIKREGEDGLILLQQELELFQGSRLELTYTVVVSNNSEYLGEGENKIYDTIKYIYRNGKRVGVIYYEENTENLVSYENDNLRNNKIVYHNAGEEEFSADCLSKEVRTEKKGRLSKYQEIDRTQGNYHEGNERGEADIITSKVTNIVDFVNQPFVFTTQGIEANKDWEVVKDRKNFVSSREDYSVTEDGDIVYGEKVDKAHNLVDHSLSSSIRYKGSELYRELKPGEEVSDTIVLTSTISTNASGGFEFEFPNQIEIVRLTNTAGKIVDIEGYNIRARETSIIRHLTDIEPTRKDGFTPTISTSKAQTLQMQNKTGLEEMGNIIGSNLSIVLMVLVVLAGGVILIKKYVLVKKPTE